MTRQERIAALYKALDSRVLVLDGAMGTAIHELKPTIEDWGGSDFENCTDNMLRTRPDMIETIHVGYLEAGADIIETDTFNGTPVALGEFGIGELAHQVNVLGAQVARKAADRYSTPERPRWVAGSMGPTTKALTVTGGITFEALSEAYYVQAKGLHEGGVDYFLVETCNDTRNVKAAVLGIQRLFDEGAEKIPVAISGTIEPMGTMLAGQSVDSFYTSIEHVELLYIGLNCATGPEFMTDHIRTLAGMARTRVACVPNAGLPDENGRFLETPEMIARVLSRFGEQGWLNLIGGCCGTTAPHIRALAALAKTMKPRTIPTARRSTLSGTDYLEITEDVRPIVVGERTNVLGSKKFRDLIAAEKYEEASEIARAQVKRGAHVIDVSTQQTDRDEVQDMRRFMEKVIQKVRVPLMLDSTNEKAIAEALTWCQGKAIINSVNLEEGERRFQKVVPLAKKFGAALVVGSIDERGQAIPAAIKVEVAVRSHELLTKKYGMAEEDLYFDPLVFPCATGDKNYTGSALETIEAVRGIKKALPRSKTVLGISNISFGLPPAGREVVNSVFLYHCVQAGLDMALVNSEKLERYPSIPEHERKLAEDVLFCRGTGDTADERLQAAIAAFAAHFREKKPAAAARSTLPLDERLARYIIEGSKDGLVEDLNEKLKTHRPLEIINGALMKGMDEVGRLFNNNELIVAEVLQSAEAMKAAVSHLEQFMEKNASSTRGKVLLATVKGDVHDIGKNLVDIILSNNGFEVVNLGIKVPPEKILEAVRAHEPDMIGLSGLLVKSAQQMVVTAEDLQRAGIDTPILVGGAALSRNFVDKQISKAYTGTVAYASDAMNGLELAKQIVDPVQHEALRREMKTRREKLKESAPQRSSERPAGVRSKAVRPLTEVPAPPDFERHVITNTPLDHIWKFLNPVMIYGRHLGLKSSVVRDIDTADRATLEKTEAGRKAIELKDALEALKAECREGLMKPRAVYQFFRAESEGNSIRLLGTKNEVVTTFTFQRQDKPDGLCLADYVALKGGVPDNLGLFVVTAGEGIRELAEQYKAKGEFLKCHMVQALALESAEAYAELIHSKLRSMWGFPDGPDMTMLDRFKANYRGKRYSFGYPACPRLEDQELLFGALKPEEIGVQLTDGCMMDPEASVSALVFHHPDATYFSIADLGAEAKS